MFFKKKKPEIDSRIHVVNIKDFKKRIILNGREWCGNSIKENYEETPKGVRWLKIEEPKILEGVFFGEFVCVYKETGETAVENGWVGLWKTLFTHE